MHCAFTGWQFKVVTRTVTGVQEESLVTTKVSGEGLEYEQGLTLTGWTAVAGAAALAAVALGVIMMSWKQFFDTKYGKYQLVSKRPPAHEVEVR